MPVNASIYRSNRITRSILFILMPILICGFIGCASDASSNRNAVRIGPTPPSALPAANAAAMPNKPVTLRFQPLSADLSMTPIPAEPEELSDVHALFPLGGGELVVYRSGSEDADSATGDLSIGYRSSTGAYTIGPIAYGGYEPTIARSSLGGDVPMLRVEGICGSNCPDTYYIAAQEGVPSVVLHVQAHIAEADPDGDGAIEMLASSGTAIQTSIIEFDHEGVPRIADLAAALGAASVVFENGSGLFAAYAAGTAETAHYRYDGASLLQIPAG
jgi:hypothetical protein